MIPVTIPIAGTQIYKTPSVTLFVAGRINYLIVRGTAMLYLLLVLLFVPMAGHSQELIFNYRPDDHEYLHYYYIWNQFDASVVMYEFGEAALVHGTTKQRIYLSNFVKDAEKIQGIGTQGISTDIQALARTKDFTLPADTGRVEWFGRLQSFRTPCDPVQYDTLKGEGPNRPGPDWGILDRTEFVIQLVRSSDDLILATLDSLGVNPTDTNGAIDTRYGYEPGIFVHSHPIPSGHAHETVYLRISPRRYGPTPLGLTISKYTSWVNVTAQIQMSDTELKQAKEQRFIDFLAYCDSVKHETGWLPHVKGIGFTGNQKDIFNSRYFYPYRDSTTGETVWFEKHTQAASKEAALAFARQVQSNSRLAPAAIIRGITPNPINSESISISIACIEEVSAQVRLVSVQGTDVGSVWNGVLQPGKYMLPIVISSDVPNGAYLLLLEKSTGEQLYQKSVVIAR